MLQRFEVHTFFDCTATGVTNNRGRNDRDSDTWHYQRNQQRNWETVLQCISLRCQPLNIQGPYMFTNRENQIFWSFLFETDRADIFLKDDDPVAVLKEDCDGVPMIVGLGESERELFFTPYMITKGNTPNTYFVST